MILKSIRWRLQAWHSLILVVVLTGFGVTAYRVARDNQMRRIDQELQQRMWTAFSPGRPDESRGRGGPPPEQHPPPNQSSDRPPGGHHPEHDPAAWRAHMSEVISHAGALEGGQTNAFYYMFWLPDGTLMASSPGAPQYVPVPHDSGPDAGDKPSSNMRTRGEFREFSVCFHLNERA